MRKHAVLIKVRPSLPLYNRKLSNEALSPCNGLISTFRSDGFVDKSLTGDTLMSSDAVGQRKV